MKRIYIITLFFISNFVSSQVSDLFTTQISDFSIASKNQYTLVESTKSSLFTNQIGAPKLPVFSRNYVLPAGSIVTSVSSTNSSTNLIGSNYYLYPTQPDCALDGKPCPDFVEPNQTVYSSATKYPIDNAILSNDATTFGYHIVTVNFCPFNYIPKEKKLFHINQINVTIQYTVGAVEYQMRITEKRHKLTQDYVKSTVKNPALISNNYKSANQIVTDIVVTNKLNIPWKPSIYGDMPDYIVITNELLKPHFQTFVTNKIQRGIPTLLVTVEQIYQNYAGCDNAEKIRNYLKEAHQYWGAGLFVLLGGDTAIVPGRVADFSWSHFSYTDLYYCDVYKAGVPNYNWNSNGDADFGHTGDIVELGADNFIGRAPVDTLEETLNFITKINSYENLTGVPNTDYVNNMLFLGAYPDYKPWIPYFNNTGQRWHRLLADKPFLSGINLKKHLLFDDYMGTANNTYLGNEELDRPTTLDRMSNGKSGIGKFHLVSHYDHGSPFGIGVSAPMKGHSIFREDMDALTNGNSYQIMYSTSCSSGEFNNDCFAEHYVNALNSGGVAMIANSNSVGYHNYDQGTNLFNSIYGNLSPTSYYLGSAFANARDAYAGSTRKILNLTGEPSMATWSATPQNISLTVQQSIIINNSIANILPVTINSLINDAVVTLYKFNTTTNSIEVYASQILIAGSTSAQFTINPDTPGNLLVQVTAKNYLPATANVNVLFPQAHLYISGYTFIDANGNGVIEQGENVTLSINLTNSGSTNITLVNMLLSCNPLFATINNGTANTSTINAGQTVTLTGFTFTAGNNNSLPNFIEFLLNITANGGFIHNDNLFLDLKNPILTLGARTMTVNGVVTTNFQLNQAHSLQIALSNIGTVPTGALTATLSSTMTNVVISTPNSDYISINSNTGLNVTPFIFNFTGATIPVGTKPFTLTLSNSLGKTWTFNFDLNEGLPPLITNFRFTSTTSEVKLMWNPITNIQGYNVYRGDTETGNYTKINTFLVTDSSIYRDLAVVPATIYFYKVGVVSLSGNERQLDQVVTNDTPPKQGYKTWTSLDIHGAFPIATNGNNSCYSSPTLFDVDISTGNHKKEIFLNNYTSGNEAVGKIIGFKESGQEMFDIDGNPTTVSGFVNTTIAMMSKSAVGDIDNDGQAEVFSIGRNNAINQGKLYAYKTVDDNNDSKPDKLWADESIDMGWRVNRNPVLYDVDGNGFLDIIVADERQKVYVYDKNKNLLPGWPVQVPGGGDYSLGEIAVADLDHDGKGEIALGCKAVNGIKGGIYIWNHDGTPFTVNPFKEFADNEVADSGIVFADIDNDLNLDLLVTTKLGSTGISCKIYAFKQDGQPVNPTWNGVNSFNAKNWWASIPRLSVGDLNHDGNLEIALGSLNKLYLFDKNGVNVPTFPKTTNDIWESAPIIADIDNDSDSELIMNDYGKLIAFNFDGSSCLGFPIESNDGVSFISSPSIEDIDNDGKNEIVISTSNAKTFVYKTDGYNINNEWSSYRANSYNTGTYREVCAKPIDLVVKDGLDDLGVEPNLTTPYLWASTDIWIRNNPDSIYEHQNPIYNAIIPNYAYIRVKNKGCNATFGTELLNFYWAKAGSGLSWPNSWDGNHYFPAPNQTKKQGAPVGNAIIPVLQPGQETVIQIPFLVPNPNLYTFSGSEQWHFCLLARVETALDPLVETLDLYSNVQNNNGIAWKNITIVAPPEPNPIIIQEISPEATIAVGNPFHTPKTFYLEFVKEDLETGKAIYDEAEINVKMDQTLYNAWERGGKIAQQLEETDDVKRKIVKGNHVLLNNIAFEADEIGILNLKFNFLTEELTGKTKFAYHVIQKDAQTGAIIGGETYIIKRTFVMHS